MILYTFLFTLYTNHDFFLLSCLLVKSPWERDRCFRLGKGCQPSVPNRRRNPRKAPGSRTAHLEEKLDDLVSLIRSQAGQRGSGVNAAAAALEDNGASAAGAGPATGPSTSSASTPTSSTAAHHHHHRFGGSSHHAGGGGGGYQTEATSPEDDDATSLNHLPGAELYAVDYPVSDDVAEASLATFLRDMAPFCGVVRIPPGTTARELRRARPFLWLGILACTSRSLREAHAMGDRVRRAVAARVVVDQEKSLDILQGMLIFLLWPHSHRKERPFLSLWTNLCVSIVQDLGYMAAKGESAFAYVKKFWVPKQGGGPEPGVGCSRTQNSERSMDERRTLLSLYIWTTM